MNQKGGFLFRKSAFIDMLADKCPYLIALKWDMNFNVWTIHMLKIQLPNSRELVRENWRMK